MVIDDHDWIIQALTTSLEMNDEYKVVATAHHAEEARQSISHEINLVIMDIRMPPSLGRDIQHDCGIDLADEFHKNFPDVAILILSGERKVEFVQRAWAAGVEGYVLKNVVSHVDDAINAIRLGRRYTDPGLPKIPRKNLLDILTEREKEVLRHLAQITDRKQIASDLKIELATVNCHCKNIMAKADINNKEDLLKLAIEFYGEKR